LAIQTNIVQNWLVGVAVKKLSTELGTEVRIKKVSLSLLDKLNLEGTLVRDKQKDTLLYAGSVKVRITDWFIFKDKADLKFIGLEDAVIKLQRKDSIWNYQFIADYFSSPGTKKKKASNGLSINIKKVDLKNVAFLENDLWRGERMFVKIGSLVADAEEINFDTKKLTINDIKVDDPYFSLENFDGLRPTIVEELVSNKKKIKDTSLQFNTGDLSIILKKLELTNGTFSNKNNTLKANNYFDGNHILFTKINANLFNLSLKKDTLRTQLSLATKERSGFELKQLTAQVKITPQIMEFAKLNLQTNKSKLGNYYAMKFNHFNNDFSNYITNVIMIGNIDNSLIHSDDIAFFAPQLKTWKRQVKFNGNFNGTVANFIVKKFIATAASSSYVSGELSMKGLPDINKTIISFQNGNVKTNYNDAAILYPDLKDIHSPNLLALGNVLFKGSFTGSVYNFTAQGNISTNLGAIYTNIKMQFPQKAEPTYDGNLTTTQFNLGKFLSIDSLGDVSFEGKITGSSFVLAKLKTSIEGKISSIEFNKYIYKDIIANGTIQKKAFNGELNIGDPNLDLNSHVEIDYSLPKPRFNIIGDLKSSNFKTLNLLSNNLAVTGLIDVNFEGRTIDQFTGTAKLLNADVKGDYSEFSFDSLSINSFFKDSVKYLNIGSSDFNATVKGAFRILDLPKSINLFLGNYYPSYFKKPETLPQNQDFDIEITTGYIEPYLKLIDKNLEGFDEIVLKGNINTKKNTLNASLNIPYAKYDNYSLYDANFIAKGSIDSLQFNSNISSIKISDSLSFPNSTISINAANDKSVISIQTKANNALNNADLNADVYTLNDGVRIHFNPSSFILNDKNWSLEKQGEIVLKKNFVSAQNVKFLQGFQEISIASEEEDGSNLHNLKINLKEVVLGDVTNLFIKKPKLEGTVNGNIQLKDLFGNFTAEAHLKAEQLTIDNDFVGLVNIESTYNNHNRLLNFNVTSPNKDFDFIAKGNYDLKDSSEKPLDVALQINHSKVNIVEQFLGDIFSNIKGFVSGNLRIFGNPNSPNLEGNLQLQDASLKVVYTQVIYKIDSAYLKFNEEGIDFGEFVIKDTLNNKGIVKGKLYEQEFKNMKFDFELVTQKLLLINTLSKDNKQFYGKAIGKAELSLKGPETAAVMRIVAEANDTSHIYIANGASKESGEADFIVFKKIGTEGLENKNKSNFNLLVDLDVTANNKVNIDLILDEAAGDVITATGEGRLKIRAGSTEPLTIKGRYNIDKGKYNFNFQSIIRKPFILKPDAGNYIEWSGDPINADLHIAAQYTAENVTVSELISGQSDKSSYNASTKSYRGPVYIIANLNNKLSRPDISFSFDYPQNSPLKTDATFIALMNKIEKDNNEVLRQVTFLVVFNTFYPYGESSNGTAGGVINFTSIGVNSISQLVTGQLNKAASNLLYKLTKDKSLKFDVGTYFYSSSDYTGQASGISSSGNTVIDRSRINLKVGKSFLNDNIILTIGGDFDFGVAATQQGSFQWLPDVSVEFVIIKDNNKRERLGALIFSKSSPDAINSQTFGKVNRQGIGLSYKKDFEKLFARKEDTIEFKPATDSTNKSNK
jgi:hypothetical protein